ncbi:hypothetical protein GNF10_00895 [Nostoc sp. UCD121]|nr:MULTISPECIES: hypothetical protein [unclassified Nostoc]MBC1224946.1 hypothetical protein [Nostoc sp. UCD120]MBC1274572.1 hypothetical protein [Nostoc sp. UCD121]MBC1297090.1 hypothetical protein [Nostoc sp. UCD122]MBE8987212.1 hypothetical protein [Nostoc sp. LEGE 12450]
MSILTIVAAVLLVGVTGGIGYLTVADWRDRRRRDEEKRTSRSATPKRR